MQIKQYIETYQEEMIEGIRDLVAIESVRGEAEEGFPFGKGPAEALAHALAMGESLGFPTIVNLDNYVGYIEMGEGEDIMGILCHLDVVPAGGNWKHEPFGGEIENGVIYGRGVCDDKGPAVAAMYAMKIIQDMDIPLKKRIRLVLGTNEESGFGCVEYYKQKEGGFQMGFSPDAAFPLIFGEKGVANIAITGKANGDDPIRLTDISGGEADNVVAPTCQCRLEGNETDLTDAKERFESYALKHELTSEVKLQGHELLLTLEGISAHASTPELGVNAISHMVTCLSEILPESVFAQGFAKCLATETNGVSCGIQSNDEYGALTLNVGLISYEQNQDIVSANLNIRYPIRSDFSVLFQSMKTSFGDNHIDCVLREDHPPLFVDPTSPFVQALYESYRNISGDHTHMPFTIGGGTYSRAFENVVAFGVEFPGEDNRVHMSDEWLSLERFFLAVEIYADAIRKLAAL